MIHRGDVIETLRGMRANTFHGCLTDPPYGLSESRSSRRYSGEMSRSGFMGMGWDAVVPGVETWAEVLRVLKPGAFLLAFGGSRTHHRLTCAIEDAGFEIRDCLMWLYGSGFPKSKSCLKPAWEPIILARKRGPMLPLAIDACRIPASKPLKGHGARKPKLLYAQDSWTQNPANHLPYEPSGLGRWPANVLLTPESAADLDAQSGILTSGNNPAKRSSPKTKGVYGLGFGDQCLVSRGPDAGGASRFFYCAKVSKSERGENIHPTLKPLKLTEHLARLILPAEPGARLLVPFSGSGSEMLGARRAGWKRIDGIELSQAYAEIADLRMAA